MIEYIKSDDKILAIIVRDGFTKEGIEFVTPPEFSQQLAYMKHKKGHTIDPHVHRAILRDVILTQEVLFVKRGRIRADFYSDDRNYIESRILYHGDVILLAHGGHGFHMLDESEIIEVKQGPYLMESDKVRFKGLDLENEIIRGKLE